MLLEVELLPPAAQEPLCRPAASHRGNEDGGAIPTPRTWQTTPWLKIRPPGFPDKPRGAPCGAFPAWTGQENPALLCRILSESPWPPSHTSSSPCEPPASTNKPPSKRTVAWQLLLMAVMLSTKPSPSVPASNYPRTEREIIHTLR